MIRELGLYNRIGYESLVELLNKKVYLYFEKNYKITPCASATAIGGTICSDIVGYSASKGIGGVTGGNFIFFYRISRNPIRKENA